MIKLVNGERDSDSAEPLGDDASIVRGPAAEASHRRSLQPKSKAKSGVKGDRMYHGVIEQMDGLKEVQMLVAGNDWIAEHAVLGLDGVDTDIVNALRKFEKMGQRLLQQAYFYDEARKELASAITDFAGCPSLETANPAEKEGV